MYTSLYKVDLLEKKRYALILPEETPSGLNYNCSKLVDQYIWGAELISAIIDRGQNQSVITHLEISEELIYLQGKVFSTFVTEIWEKLRNSKSQCQKDILEMILTTFHSKFNQKHYSIQQIIHVNDLLFMKQTSLSNPDTLKEGQS